jgi:hypothetical protein
MVESNKLARNTVRTKWYSEKKNEPVDNTVHIRVRFAEKISWKVLFADLLWEKNIISSLKKYDS